jgi:hypothetical protein
MYIYFRCLSTSLQFFKLDLTNSFLVFWEMDRGSGGKVNWGCKRNRTVRSSIRMWVYWRKICVSPRWKMCEWELHSWEIWCDTEQWQPVREQCTGSLMTVSAVVEHAEGDKYPTSILVLSFMNSCMRILSEDDPIKQTWLVTGNVVWRKYHVAVHRGSTVFPWVRLRLVVFVLVFLSDTLGVEVFFFRTDCVRRWRRCALLCITSSWPPRIVELQNTWRIS